jgi:hypothetical protein
MYNKSRRKQPNTKMKRISTTPITCLLLLATGACNTPTNSNESSSAKPQSDTNESVAFSAQKFRMETVVGPDLQRAIDDTFPGARGKIRGIGIVAKRDSIYFVAVHFVQEKDDPMDEKGVIFLDGIVLIGKDGKPYWKLHIFALNRDEFFKEYAKLNGAKSADAENDK